MADLRAQRTLVKSPPELWAELSDPDSLARRLSDFGEIRITRLVPEKTVAWEGERASGTVELESSGWGTRVRLTAIPRGSQATPATVAAIDRVTAVIDEPDPGGEGPPPTDRPPPDRPALDPHALPAALRRAGTAEPRPRPAAPARQPGAAERSAARAAKRAAAAAAAPTPPTGSAPPSPPQPETIPTVPPTPPPVARRGFFARLFARLFGRSKAARTAAVAAENAPARPAPASTAPPKQSSPASPDPGAPPAAPAQAASPARSRAPAPTPDPPAGAPATSPPPRPLPIATRPSTPTRARSLPKEPARYPLPMPAPPPALDPEQTMAVLSSVLDDLGAAHHRPFSRE